MFERENLCSWYESSSQMPFAIGSCSADAIFPGAFNPLHDGHRRMAEIAAETLAVDVAFEISILNVDKTELSPDDLEQRLRGFPDGCPVWLSRAATFVEKTRIFPRAVFVVGADTIVRMSDPKYYGSDDSRRDHALQVIAASGCRFLVFGRSQHGQFRTLDHLELPDVLREICQGVSEQTFRADVSSTSLRS